MTSHTYLNEIVLTLIQATGLLLPVVLVTFRFYVNNKSSSVEAENIRNVGKVIGLMILLLSVTGFSATLGVLDLPIKRLLAFISTLSLAAFFAIYGWFIYRAINWDI